jgi:hypothetical protein
MLLPPTPVGANRRAVALAVALALSLAPGVVPGIARAQSCPLPEGTLGFPVVATSAEPVDAAWLSSFAEAAAYRWRVPSGRRATHDSWERVRDRMRTPEPRWADDWQPKPAHRARMTLVVRRDGNVVIAGTPATSGDRDFDRSLESIVKQPMPAAPELPRLPAAFAADSVVVSLTFGGDTVPPGAGLVRFAAQQRPVRLLPGTLRVVPNASRAGASGGRGGASSSRGMRATVKYDVSAEGLVVPGSVEILQSSDPELSRAIEEGLRTARFTPAQSDCRSIAQSVLQNFGQ